MSVSALKAELSRMHKKGVKWAIERIRDFYEPSFYACGEYPPVITAIVEGDNGIYSVYIGPDGYSCSCIGQTVHKKPCKHIIFLIFYSILNGHLTPEMARHYLRLQNPADWAGWG